MKAKKRKRYYIEITAGSYNPDEELNKVWFKTYTKEFTEDAYKKLRKLGMQLNEGYYKYLTSSFASKKEKLSK